ncbi:probable CCR4-associated factor 1 homolog 11 [Trifolium pratense]|uniref:probable CCR4-associated factor 1 homolog 11 n=1 Tax=Trifolium pratense TaxID=57577 RepID=UPI001E6919B2|nr:probable CCR4-associated factor 1 homolog 11 [Trifolium pratense]
MIQKFKMKEELSRSSSKPVVIRQVWAHNLEDEFDRIRKAVVDGYRMVSMDTEFPGVVYPPKVDSHHLRPSDIYGYLKVNVDALKLIQLGLTLSDASGNLPFEADNCYIWEFNFCDFDVRRDPHNKDSIDLLRRQGIDFNCNVIHGVNSFNFSELMKSSGLVHNKAVTWVTFHGIYDFGYLVKILKQSNLPDSLEGFLYVMRDIFGTSVYDMKYMIQHCNGLYGGLERVASILKVGRIAGKSHQAASDSLLTWQAFQKMKLMYFSNNEVKNHAGMIFGLEVTSY